MSGKVFTSPELADILPCTAGVNCHGPEGKGGRATMMMWSFNTPDITRDNLTETEYHEAEPDEEEHENAYLLLKRR